MSIGFSASLTHQDAERSSIELHVEDKTLEQIYKSLSNRAHDFPLLSQVSGDLYGDSVISQENLEKLHDEIAEVLGNIFSQTQEYEILVFLQTLDAMCMVSQKLGLTLYGFSD